MSSLGWITAVVVHPRCFQFHSDGSFTGCIAHPLIIEEGTLDLVVFVGIMTSSGMLFTHFDGIVRTAEDGAAIKNRSPARCGVGFFGNGLHGRLLVFGFSKSTQVMDAGGKNLEEIVGCVNRFPPVETRAIRTYKRENKQNGSTRFRSQNSATARVTAITVWWFRAAH